MIRKISGIVLLVVGLGLLIFFCFFYDIRKEPHTATSAGYFSPYHVTMLPQIDITDYSRYNFHHFSNDDIKYVSESLEQIEKRIRALADSLSKQQGSINDLSTSLDLLHNSNRRVIEVEQAISHRQAGITIGSLLIILGTFMAFIEITPHKSPLVESKGDGSFGGVSQNDQQISS
jgi:hypothetical protein